MKKLLALLPFLALMLIVSSCSDDDSTDNPTTPAVTNVLELESDATISKTHLIAASGDNLELVVLPELKNTGDAKVEMKMSIEITSIEGNVAIGACLGDGVEAQCLNQFDEVGMHDYASKKITLAAQTVTNENHLSVHYYMNNNIGSIKGNLIFTNVANAKDVITIPYEFESKKFGL